TKAAELVQKLDQGGKFADVAAASGLKLETSAPFRRDAKVAGLPDPAVDAAFRTAKDAAGQAQGVGGGEAVVFRVTDVTVPPLDMASEDAKKLKDALQRSLTDEQIAQYVTKLESEIGTTINES